MVWMLMLIALLGGVVTLLIFLTRGSESERGYVLGSDRDLPHVDEPLHSIRFRTEWEANAAVARLIESGIDAVPSGGFTASQGFDCTAYAYVLVPKSARERAEMVLASPEEIDWSNVDVGGPDPDMPDAPTVS